MDHLPFNLTQMLVGVFGGLALFLYGLDKMGSSLRYLAGHKLRRVLLNFTQNRFMGLFSGVLMTMMLQSSTATTVLLVGFVSAELVTLSRALAVILGADIGTTITVQLIAFKLSDYALLPVAVGFLLQFIAADKRLKETGHAVMGLGLMFFGIGLLGHTVEPLRDWPMFTDLMANVKNPLWGIIVGAAFTAIVQSSAATMAVVITLATQELITFEAAIMLTLGANIGTCFTALLAAIGKPREAVRTAVAHGFFKVVGVLLLLPFIDYFIHFIQLIPPGTQDISREVANAHMAFNLCLALLFLPLLDAVARLLVWVIPHRSSKKKGVQAAYLDDVLLETPMLAFAATRQEMARVAEHLNTMMRDILPIVTQGSRADLHVMKHQDDAIDDLHGQIVNYLAKASQLKLTEDEQKELLGLIHTANAMENIGDLIETNLVALGKKRIRLNFEIEPKDLATLSQLHAEVSETLAKAMTASLMQNTQLAGEVIGYKTRIRSLVEAATKHEAARLAKVGSLGIDRYTFEHDIIDKLQRIYYHARKMAQNTITPGFNSNLNTL